MIRAILVCFSLGSEASDVCSAADPACVRGSALLQSASILSRSVLKSSDKVVAADGEEELDQLETEEGEEEEEEDHEAENADNADAAIGSHRTEGLDVCDFPKPPENPMPVNMIDGCKFYSGPKQKAKPSPMEACQALCFLKFTGKCSAGGHKRAGCLGTYTFSKHGSGYVRCTEQANSKKCHAEIKPKGPTSGRCPLTVDLSPTGELCSKTCKPSWAPTVENSTVLASEEVWQSKAFGNCGSDPEGWARNYARRNEACPGPPETEPLGFKMIRGMTDGNDGNHVGPEGKVCDLASCARFCLSFESCMSFKFNKNDPSGRNCWLKDKVFTGSEGDGHHPPSNGWYTFYRAEETNYVMPEPVYASNNAGWDPDAMAAAAAAAGASTTGDDGAGTDGTTTGDDGAGTDGTSTGTNGDSDGSDGSASTGASTDNASAETPATTVAEGQSCSEANLESLTEEQCEAYCTSIEASKTKGSNYNQKVFQVKGHKNMHHGCVLVAKGPYAGDCRFNPEEGSQGNAKQSGLCQAK